MSRNATKPGLTAAMTAGRALLAAGWRYDSTSPMADDTTIRTLLHPTGREIHARTDDRDGDTTSLTMTGLSLEQVAGAVTGAGLAAPVQVAAVNAKAKPEAHAELPARLHTTAGSIAAALRRAAAALDAIADGELSPVAVQINLQAVTFHGTAEERKATVDALGMALVGHAGQTGEGDDPHHRLPWEERSRGDLEVAVYTGLRDFGSRS